MENFRQKEIVFHRPWFNRHQTALLRLANFWLGRKILHIDGDRSSVGKKKIIKIEPNAITWRNDDGTLSTEFRTHAKFAKRMYYAFKPIWYLMHLWDNLTAPVPYLNLGFDTLTAYPNANPETNSVDGWVARSVEYGTWAQIRDGVGTDADDTGYGNDSYDFFFKMANAAPGGGDWQLLQRSFFLFDTSSLGSTAGISSAVLSLYGYLKYDGRSVSPDINIFSSNPASNTALVTGDYNNVGSTAFSSAIAYADFSITSYNNFTLNASGLAVIAKTGTSKFSARNGNYDAANVNNYNTGTSYMKGYFADKPGTTNDPKLVITYGIPATITNSVNFVCENDIPLTISNPENLYLEYELYVNGNLKKTEQIGQVTSYTIEPTSGEFDSMYAEIPNATSCAMYVRLKTYLDAGYTTQVGSNQDKTGTMSIDQVANKPIFTTFTMANVDKTIDVKDKYDNTLVSSSTSTLLGSNAKMIADISKVRATVSVANKATAQNSATMVKYRFVNDSQYKEENYSAVADVTMDIDNCTANLFDVSAYDSRNLVTTVVGETLSYIADYFDISIYGLTAIRTDNVGEETTLAFDGLYFNEYFGGGTSGVQNDFTCEYRYKETDEAWGAQSWTDITADVADTDGVLEYSQTIDGDLGASGFDTAKSYNVEVRIYDRLSQVILETTINKGVPLVEYYDNGTLKGVSINGKYDTVKGGSLQVDEQIFTPDTILRSGFFRNALLNGNFNIHQRGTSFSLPDLTFVYGADRFLYYQAKDGGTLPTLVNTIEACTPGEIFGTRNFNRITTNGAGASLGADSRAIILNRIENGTRFLCGDGKKVTVSFLARSSIANKKLGIVLKQKYGGGGTPTSPEAINGTNFDLTSSWVLYSHTFDTNTLSGKTFGTTTPDYLELDMAYQWGSNHQASYGADAPEDYGGAGTIDIAQIQVNPGEQVLLYTPESPIDELRACQRYFEKSFNYSVAPADATGTTGALTAVNGPTTSNYLTFGTVFFKVRKMTIPTITHYNPGASSTYKGYNTSSAANVIVTDQTVGESSFNAYVNGAATANYQTVVTHWTATAELS